MKKQFVISLSAVAGSVLLSACGDDVTKVTNVTNETSSMEIVASADSLGKCDSSTLEKTVYASNEKAAYVCTDSGWVSLDQKASDGKSCTAETLEDSSGYRIVCGGDSVGVIRNGENGSDGKDGEDGEKGDSGKNGTTCTVEILSDGTGYKVVCGGDSVGVIRNGADGNSCIITDHGDGTVLQVCGADTITLYKAFCAGKAYDPAKAYCFEDSAYSCGEKPYDPTREFCHEKEAHELCGGKAYDPSITFCDARDTTFYRYVVIGTQTWMAENLNFDNHDASTATSYCYNDDADSCDKYGRLYPWDDAMASCPEGWHLPDTAEWNTLRDYVGENTTGGIDSSGYALKSTSDWHDNGNGSDAFGFGALPAGYLDSDVAFHNVHVKTDFWSANEKSTAIGYVSRLYYYGVKLHLETSNKDFAYSVRCVKD